MHHIAPNRRAIPERIIPKGNLVIVQAAIVNPDMGSNWKTPFCVILTLKDGKIIKDESYLDMTAWPSPLLAPQDFEKLGLERKRSFLQLALIAIPSVLVRKATVAKHKWIRSN